MAFDRAGVEEALVPVLLAACPPGARVILADQGGPRPAVPFLEVAFEGWDTLGLDGESSLADTPGAPAGAELTESVSDNEERTLTIRAFTGAVTTGNGSAGSLLERVARRLRLESVLEALAGAGIEVVDVLGVQDATALLDTTYEGVASVGIRLRGVGTESNTLTRIDTFEVSGSVEHG